MSKEIESIHTPDKALAQAARRRVIRVRKEDSAFIYCVLESHEGIASYSTLPSASGGASPHRDIELWVPDGFSSEMDELLRGLGELVYDLNHEQR